MTTDRELLSAYAISGDDAAFAELVKRHLAMVYSAAVRQLGGNDALAKDVAQAVFVDLARKAGKLPPSTVVAGWLFTSTHYAAANAVRSERRRRKHEQEAFAMQVHEASARDADWQKVRPVLDDALSALDPAEREAVVLRFFAGRTFGEIGTELTLKDDTARVRVERALDKLAALLRRRGVASTNEALALALTSYAVAAVPRGLAQTITSAAIHAKASAAVGVTLKSVALMSTTKTIGIVIAAVLVLLLAIDLKALRRNTDALRQTTEQLGRESAALARLSGETSRPIANPIASTNAPPPRVLAGYSDRNLLGDPKYGLTIARRHRRYAMANYRGAIEQLHLSRAEEARLKDLIVARWLAIQDAGDVIDRMEKPSGGLWNKAKAAAEADPDKQIKDLLGPDRYTAFQQAYDVASTRGMNWALFTQFWDSGAPLTPDQETALAGELARAAKAEQADPKLRDPDPQLTLRPVDRQVLDASAHFLSPKQLAILQERRLAEAEYAEAVRLARAEKSATNDAQP